MLTKNPAFTLVAVLTLALGIGATTALVSVVNAVLLDPLPYPHPNQLVSLYTKTPQLQWNSTTYLNFLDWQQDNRTFEAIAAYRDEDFNLTGAGEPERLRGHMVSAGFFPMLGVNPVLGRAFRPEEDRAGASPVVLLGDGMWKRRFGSSADVLGKTLTLDGTVYAIIGVVPGRSPMMSPSDIFVPIGQWTDPTFRDRRVSMGMNVVGRLKPGVTQAQASTDMDGIARNLAAAYPEADAGMGVSLIPLKKDIVGDVEPFLFVLLGAVGFVLLIACSNVANLLLARATRRSREFSIRAALGASRGCILRQLLTESILLGVTGGVLGLLLAKFGTGALLTALPAALPRAEEIGLDLHVLLFTLAVSAFAGIAFGLAPALKISRSNLFETLKEGGRGSRGQHHRAQRVFVAAEVALALVLLVGAGLMTRSLAALWSIDPGFDAHNVLTFSLSLAPEKASNPVQIRASSREMLQRLAAVPGVQAVSESAGSLPMRGDSELPFWREGQPKPANDNDMNWSLFYAVTQDYWKTLGVQLVRGRYLMADDNENSHAVIDVDETFARRFFPNEDPIGKRVNLGLIGTQPEIVGIVHHVEHWGLGNTGHQTLQGELYLPLMQVPDQFMPLVARGLNILVRTAGPAQSFAGPLRSASAQFDSHQVVFDFQAMEAIVSDSIASQRFAMILLGAFAGVALILAAVGIYGVVSYLVGQRTQEVGIRMALGAQRRDVLRLVLGEGTKMAWIGVGIGFVAALGLTRLMASMLFGVSKTDPLTFAAVSLLLMAIVTVACYIPARRATRVDPMVALRYE
jgi:predicted permease